MSLIEPVIKIEHLFKSFGSNHVLNDFNLVLNKGENLAVIGKSGSGKSVLIKCIIGLLKFDSGKIIVLGKDVSKLNQKELDQLRIKVAFLFQSNALYDSMSVRENLEFPLRRHNGAKTNKNVDELVHEVLENVGLSHTINMMPSELSGGMKKRIALARTLIMKPDIILYDEPTTGLDPITAREISQLMLNIQQHYNTSSIIISHDLSCVKLTSNKIILLINGKNYAEGTYEEFTKSDNKEIINFFG
jgi:phospholipid/cholesterol/gamma-HCH transport system ATP-binding protein